jgi:PAS domain S-box-containing protein
VLQQERLSAIVENSDGANISKDLNGIIRWNRGAERIFGYAPGEIIGRHISTLAVPERIDEIPDILSHLGRGERVDHYQSKRKTKDGRVLTISLTVSPTRLFRMAQARAGSPQSFSANRTGKDDPANTGQAARRCAIEFKCAGCCIQKGVL